MGDGGGEEEAGELLREWGPLSHILSRIPAKAQRGLSTFPLHLTALAASGDLLALGTNVGLIYCFNRATHALHRLKTHNTGVGISSVALLSSPDILVGGGSEDGELTLFQISPASRVIPFQCRGGRVHGGRISTLEWSSNGLKLFSGDVRGAVALTQLDFEQGVGDTRLLFEEAGSEVVGLSYLRQHLLISTTLHSTIFSLPTHQTRRVGSQERKIAGRFGGLWVKTSLTEPSIHNIYSVRPGGRVWVADIHGTVHHTIKFKDILMQGNHASVPISTTDPTNLNTTPLQPEEGGSPPRSGKERSEFQLHSLFHWKSGCLVATGSSSATSGGAGRPLSAPLLLLLDPINSAILGVCNELGGGGGGGILDVAVNLDGDGEIFILQPNRHLLRLASHPDPFPTTTPTPPQGSREGQESGEGSRLPQHYFLRNLPQMMMPMTSNAKQLMMSSMSMAGDHLDTPLALLTSILKQTSRRLAAPVHQTSTSILQGLRQVFEGEVEDGLWPPLTTIPLHPPPPPTSPRLLSRPSQSSGGSTILPSDPPRSGGGGVEDSQQEEREELMMVRDKFGHISQLPFDDVLLSPTGATSSSKLIIRRKNGKKRRVKGGGMVEPASSGDTVSLSSSTHSIHSTQQPEDESSSTIEQSESGRRMSQSWSHPTQKEAAESVLCSQLDGDLESKEELLARKLNWPELIPESKRGTLELGQFSGGVVQLAGEDEVVEEPTPSQLAIQFQLLEEEESQRLLQTGANPESMSSLEESLDIYTRYRDPSPPPSPSGDQEYANHGTTGATKEPELSFGPPSSTSSNHPSISLTTQQLNPTIVQIEETDLPSSSSSTTEELDAEGVTPKGSPSTSSCFSSKGSREEIGADLMPVRDMVVEPLLFESADQKDQWISIPAPSPLAWLTVSDEYILVMDRKKGVYVAQLPSPSSSSSSFRWVQLSRGWSGDVLGLSPCGHLLWRLLGSTLYYSVGVARISSLFFSSPSSTRIGRKSEQPAPSWVKLLSDVSSFSLGRGVGWVVRGDGSLHYVPTGEVLQGALGGGVPQFHPVSTPIPVVSVAGGGVAGKCCLWALGSDGRLFYRVGMSEEVVCGTEWGVVAPSALPSSPIVSLTLVESTLFLSDTESNLYFLSQSGEPPSFLLWKVMTMGDPHLRRSPTTPSPTGGGGAGFSLSGFRAKLRPVERLLSLSKGQEDGAPILSGSGGALWWSLRGSSILHFNPSLVVGHRWETLEVSRPLRKSRGGGVGSWWVGLMGGSIYLEHGVLWLLDNKGKLFYSHPTGGDAKSIDLPTSSALSCVVPAPDALWLLTKDEGVIWARDNIGPINPVGHGWAKIDLSSQERLHLVFVSCGSDVAWACDSVGRVYFRSGSLRPPVSPEGLSPPWVLVEPNDPTPTASRVRFTKVYVGASGTMVWALDSSRNVWVREAVFPDFPIGTRWLLVSGLEATSLALSESGVWALSVKKGGPAIFRRYGISKNNFVGDYWREIPSGGGSGVLVDLTVSLCDQAWALDGGGWMGKHVSTTLKFTPPSPPPLKSRTVLDPEDRDWELIDSVDLT